MSDAGEVAPSQAGSSAVATSLAKAAHGLTAAQAAAPKLPSVVHIFLVSHPKR